MNFNFKKLSQQITLILLFVLITGLFLYVSYSLYEIQSPQHRAAKEIIQDNHRIKRALFSPDDNIQEILVGMINSEKEHIRITAFSITNDVITSALIQAKKRGVVVEAIVDGSNATTPHSKVNRLYKKGIHLWIYPSTNRDSRNSRIRSGIMHDKFIIFQKSLMDRPILWTGSFNFTRSANDYNEENVIVIDDAYLISAYTKQFERLKKRCIEATR